MRKHYRPRRASKQWLDGDCPKGVLMIFDHEDFFDRYIIICREPVTGSTLGDMCIQYLSFNDLTHPQGSGQRGEMTAVRLLWYRAKYRRKQTRWSDLPENVKQLVRQDLERHV
jgi:hypothetical protein